LLANDPAFAAGSLAEVLLIRVAQTPDAPAYCFLMDGEEAGPWLSYAALDREARTVAAALQMVAEPGDRALLLHAPGAGIHLGILRLSIRPAPTSFKGARICSQECQNDGQERQKVYQGRQEVRKGARKCGRAPKPDTHSLAPLGSTSRKSAERSKPLDLEGMRITNTKDARLPHRSGYRMQIVPSADVTEACWASCGLRDAGKATSWSVAAR
jgi:hypothetical protein